MRELGIHSVLTDSYSLEGPNSHMILAKWVLVAIECLRQSKSACAEVVRASDGGKGTNNICCKAEPHPLAGPKGT